MSDRPTIPYDPWPDAEHYKAKRWIRKLAEAGKLSGRRVSVPHHGETTEKRSFHPKSPDEGKVS